MKKMALLGVADTNYLKRYIMAFDSFMSNTTSDYDVFILGVETDTQEEDLIANYFRNAHSKTFNYLRLTDEQKARIAKYPTYNRVYRQDYITETTLYKWFGFELLKARGYDAVVYFDPDTLTVKNADEFFTVAETIETIGAVPHGKSYSTVVQSMNAGVLLVNLSYITEELSAKYDETVISFNGHAGDQAVMNSMFGKTFTKLDKKFNLTSGDSLKVLDDTILVHFTGAKKPWNDTQTLDFVKDQRIMVYRDALAKKLGVFLEYGLSISF